MNIRPEGPGDVEAIAAVVEAAFGSATEAQLVAAIRASPYFVPELSLVAEEADRVVGHVMVSFATLLRPDGKESPVAMLSPLAVAPARQRRGIGSALVRAATAGADERGEPLLVLEGDPAFYGRLGFELSARYNVSLPIPSWAPLEAAQLIRLSRFDPSVAGQVVYPPAFAGLA